MGDFIPVATILLMLLPAPIAFSKFSLLRRLGDAVPDLREESVRFRREMDGVPDGDLECVDLVVRGIEVVELLFSDCTPSGFEYAPRDSVFANVVVESAGPSSFRLGVLLLASLDATVVESSTLSGDFDFGFAALKSSLGKSAADMAIVPMSPSSAEVQADIGSVGWSSVLYSFARNLIFIVSEGFSIAIRANQVDLQFQIRIPKISVVNQRSSCQRTEVNLCSSKAPHSNSARS